MRTFITTLSLLTANTAFALPQPMLLSMSNPLVPGQPVQIVVDNAVPNSRLQLVQSDGSVGAGACPPPLAGSCMDITAGSGYQLLSVPLRADANGRATFSGVLPPNIPAPQDWAFQVVDISTAQGSNPMERRVLPAPACSDDVYEPNQSIFDATPIDSDISARLCGNELDHYRLDLTAGEVLSTTISYDRTLTNLEVTIIDAFGGVLAADSGSNDDIADVYVDNSTSYYVRVRRAGGSDPVSYDLSFSTQTCPADDQDCDGNLAADDCDDFDPDSLPISQDADCDGVPTAQDCTEVGGNCGVGEGDCDAGDCATGLSCQPDIGANWGYPSYFDVCVPCPADAVLFYTPQSTSPMAATSAGGFHSCDTGFIVEVQDLDDNPWDFTPFVDWGDAWPLPTTAASCADAWAEATIQRVATNGFGWTPVATLDYTGVWSTNPFDFGCRLVPSTPAPVFDRTNTSAVRITGNAGGPLGFDPTCTGFCLVTTARTVSAGVRWLVPPN